MSWRLARSLVQLRNEINAKYPGRSKFADGSIGDRSHRGRRSDHNPDHRDVVRAIDVTAWSNLAIEVCEHIRKSKDPRVKYVIYNRQMFSSYGKGSVPAWEWRVYSGSNPHKSHFHISVVADNRGDDSSTWGIGHPPTFGDDEVELTKNIQVTLKQAGFDPGPADGVWGPRTQAAFVKALKETPRHEHSGTVRVV